MNRTDKLIERSIDWNKRKLPFNTHEMQIKKMDEEVVELLDALKKDDKEEILKEAADAFIAISGEGRFSLISSEAKLGFFFEMMPSDVFDKLHDYVEDKLNKLEELNYQIVDGVYRHVEN